MSYPTGFENLGRLFEERVKVAYMPRDRFLALVEHALNESEPSPDPEERAEIYATAKSLDHFPLGEWMTERGCGCVVGEMFARRDETLRGDSKGVIDAVSFLGTTGLHQFGLKLDLLMATEIGQSRALLPRWVPDDHIKVVVFRD